MKEQLDLVKILKDCPEGMELDCTMYDNVTLKSVSLDINNGYPICIKTKHGFSTKLTKYGQNICINDAKCVIFPKGKKTWEGFQRPFVDGDIVFYNNTIAIFKEWGDETLFRTYVTKYLCCDSLIDINIPLFGKGIKREIRFATEKEKKQLFQAIKDHGYKWNPETKTLEKLIVPKFKIGDKVVKKGCNIPVLISEINDGNYYSTTENSIGYFKIKEQDDWILIPNKFDPKTLKPFESKVLVSNYGKWAPAIFGCYNKEHSNVVVVVGGNFYTKCIPYEGNEHLIDTYDQPSEFYRYWEN